MDDPPAAPQSPADGDGRPPIECDACRSALRAPDRAAMSYLLTGRLTVPIVGCEAHRRQFRDVCEFSTDASVDLLAHRPAGGITCPGCRCAPRRLQHPVVPLGGGAVTVIACPEHETAVLDRFQTGLETRHQLAASLDSR